MYHHVSLIPRNPSFSFQSFFFYRFWKDNEDPPRLLEWKFWKKAIPLLSRLKIEDLGYKLELERKGRGEEEENNRDVRNVVSLRFRWHRYYISFTAVSDFSERHEKVKGLYKGLDAYPFRLDIMALSSFK